MWFFHVVLETAFPRLLSMSAPTEQHSPHSPSDLDTVFFLRSSLAADSSAAHILGQIGYFISYFVHWNILSLCFPHLPLLSLYYLSITPLTSRLLFPPRFPNFSSACSTITCSLTKGDQAAERDVSDRAGGLAEVPLLLLFLYWQLLPACLPACLVLRSSRVVLHADERKESSSRKMKKREWEWRKEGRKDAALSFHSTWRVWDGEKQEKVKWAQVISSKSPLLSARD